VIRSLAAVCRDPSALTTAPRASATAAGQATGPSPHDRNPRSKPYGPWHDATTAVDGDAARALGEFGRARWRLATGQNLTPPPLPPGVNLWPAGLVPQFRDLTVAVARTEPAFDGDAGVREVEALTLAATAAARRTI
jgi:phospholipase D1/2